jgi:hypothetical protein
VDALGAAGFVGFLVARFVPVARLPFWGCSFRKMTGWPCPGCGLTRVADRMSHFNFVGAWQANPLGAVAAGLFMLAIVASSLHLAFRLPMPEVDFTRRERATFRVAGVVALVVNYAYVIVATKFPELLQGVAG